MGVDAFEISINFAKMIAIFLMMVQAVPLLVWVERRGSAFIQNRFGPNRVGPLGLVQLLADAVKFIFKEEFVPGKGHRLVFYAAPVVALIPGALAFAAIPLGLPIEIPAFTNLEIGVPLTGITFFTIPGEFGPYRFAFQGYEMGIGIVFVLGVSSLAAYALLMAGWGSANKFSLYGALRASAQTISYELALGLSLVGILLLFNSFDFRDVIEAQNQALSFHWKGEKLSPAWAAYLPNWGIFYQPLGAVIFFAAMFAETNRLPFDLPEAEAELVAGYHTEYGGIKMNMFYIGEYGHMLVASALMVTFYFGGYSLYPLTTEMVTGALLEMGFKGGVLSLLTSLTFHLFFIVKLVVFLWIFVHVRWTLPRFRYDQLMDLGWKTMLPWALANTILTAIFVLVMRSDWS